MNKLIIELNQMYGEQVISLLGETKLCVNVEYTYLLSMEKFDSLSYRPMHIATACLNECVLFKLRKGNAGYTITVDGKVYKTGIESNYRIMMTEFTNAIIIYAINKRNYILSEFPSSLNIIPK